MLTKPDEWDFSISGLKHQLKEGKDSISATMKELMSAGYITRGQDHSKDGKFKGVVYNVYESPVAENPLAGNPSAVKPSAGNQPLVNTNTSKDYIKVNTETSKTDCFDDGYDFNMFWDQYGYKKDRHKSEQLFNKLPADEKQKIKNTLSFYIAATTTNRKEGGEFKPMRKHPSTYLNQKVWQDYESQNIQYDVDLKTCKGSEIPETFYLKHFNMGRSDFRSTYGMEGLNDINKVLREEYGRTYTLIW